MKSFNCQATLYQGQFTKNDKVMSLPIDKLQQYADIVMRYNKLFNLTAARNSEDFMKNHIQDALLALPLFENYSDKTIYDIGSGSGVPGIPLAICLEDSHFVLVERKNKRCDFLISCVKELNLEDRITIRNADLKIFKNEIEVLTFRALSNFENIKKILYSSLTDNGIAILYKGRVENCKKEDYSKFSCAEFISLLNYEKERTMVVLRK